MDHLSNYKIEYTGLKEGVHNFAYDIDQLFFDSFPGSPIQQGNLHVDLTFEKEESFFMLDFTLKGQVGTECDRCLEALDVPIEGEFKVIIKFDNDLELGDTREDDDVVFIAPNETNLNVSGFIYEFSVLSLPLRKVHPEGECNEEVMNILNNQDNAPEVADPRWEGLAKIKTK